MSGVELAGAGREDRGELGFCCSCQEHGVVIPVPWGLACERGVLTGTSASPAGGPPVSSRCVWRVFAQHVTLISNDAAVTLSVSPETLLYWAVSAYA